MFNVNQWMERIKLGKEFKRKYAFADKWESWQKLYCGLDSTTNKELKVNRILSLGKTMIANTYLRDPTVMITPLRPEYRELARVVESVDNYLIRELGLKKTMKRVLLDAYICGTGIIKLGYDSEFGYSPAHAVLPDSETLTQISTKEQRKIEYSEFVKPGMPWALRVNPRDIVVPWGYEDFDSIPWIAHRVIRPLKDVQEDSKYIKSATKKLRGSYTPRIEVGNEAAVASDPLVELWEVRTVDEGKVYVFAENQLLFEDKDALQIEGLPYVFIVFNMHPVCCWGLSDVWTLLPQQKELDEIRVQQSRLRRYSLLKFLYQKGVLVNEELDKLLSDDLEDIGVGIAVEADAPGAAVIPLQPPALTQELTLFGREVESDMRETFGLSKTQLGEIVPYHGKTATEIMAVQQAATLRMDERRDAAADALATIIRKWNQFVFTFWDGKRTFEVIGEDGMRYWVTFTGEQIRGEYAIKVDPEAMLPVNRQVRYNMTLQLAKMFANDPMIDQVLLHRLVLSQFEWIDPTIIKLLAPQQPQQGGVSNAAPPVQMPEMQPGVRGIPTVARDTRQRALSEMLGGMPEGLEMGPNEPEAV